MTAFDYPDAPPHTDADRIPGVPSPDATAIAIALNRIATALERLSVSPGGAPSPPPGTPNGAPSGDDPRIKMSKKVFAICKQNSWEIGDIGQRVTGRNIGADSRKWSMDDLKSVLDAMKEWGVG